MDRMNYRWRTSRISWVLYFFYYYFFFQNEKDQIIDDNYFFFKKIPEGYYYLKFQEFQINRERVKKNKTKGHAQTNIFN